MRSAYMVLGVPGNASQEDIQEAFERSQQFFSRERLAAEAGAMEKFAEVQQAYRILSEPEMRAAHDRKLTESARPPRPSRTVIEVVPEVSPARKWLIGGVWLLVLVFGAGFYLSYRNAETRREAIALEQAARLRAEQEAARQQKEAEEQAAARAKQAEKAELAERRLMQESRYVADRAQADMRRQEAMAAQAVRVEQAQARQADALRASQERQAAYEARQRVERDKQKVREICYQLYRRPDC